MLWLVRKINILKLLLYFVHNIQAHSCRSTDNINYTVNVVNTCNGSSFSHSIQTPYLFTVPYTPECTVINIIAENGIGAWSRSVDYMSETGGCKKPLHVLHSSETCNNIF